MSYGIRLENKFGDRVLASTGLLFPLTTGQMVYGSGRYVANGSEPFWWVDHLDHTGREGGVLYVNGSRIDAAHINYPQLTTQTVSNLTDGGSFDNFDFVAGNILQVVTNNFTESYQPRTADYQNKSDYNIIRHAVPNTSDTTYNYEAFFKLPSVGGLHSFAQVYNPYNFLFDANCKGLHLYAQKTEVNGTGSAIDYVVGTTKPPNVASESHGMQVFDENSNTIYDTRYVVAALGIKDYVRITSAQAQDCIQNGTTYNFTLRQAIDPSKAHLGGGSFNSYRNRWVSGTGHVWDVPTLKMTSSTNLQMYRTTYRYSSGGGFPNYTRERYEECLITILEN